MPSQASETPHTNRDREALDGELWDALANVVYDAELTTLDIPCIIDCRLEIHAKADLAAAGSLTIMVDGSSVGSAATIPGAGTVVNFTIADVSRGTRTVTLIATAGINSCEIMVRRGRTPRTA